MTQHFLRRRRAPGALVLLPALLLSAGARANPTLPLTFAKNQGQAAATVRFLVQTRDGAVGFTDRGMQIRARATELSLTPEGARVAAPVAEGAQRAVLNLYRGKRAITGIPTYSRVRYKSLWAGTDLLCYGRSGQLEYDLQLAVGADPRTIGFRLRGAPPALDAQGNLIAGGVTLQKPVSYQTDARGRRHTVASRFTLSGNRLGFALGKYDHRRPLTIDPKIAFSTFLGGSGGDTVVGFGGSYVRQHFLQTDAAGNVYLVGSTISPDFGPIANDLGKRLIPDDADVFVAKLDPSGNPIFITLLGGTFNLDRPRALGVDSAGNAYVACNSFVVHNDFPQRNSFFSSGPPNTNSAYVTKLGPTGQLLYSTLIGQRVDEFTMVTDRNGVCYLGGTVIKDGNVPGVHATQGHPHTAADAFAMKLAPNGAVVFSTPLGGTTVYDNEGAVDVAYGPDGSLWLLGAAGASFDASGFFSRFPLANPVPLDPTGGATGGGLCAFVAHFDPQGNLGFSTLLGGYNSAVGPLGIECDAGGYAVAVGTNYDAGWMVNQGPHIIHGPDPSPGTVFAINDIWVAKFTPGPGPSHQMVYLDFIGGEGRPSSGFSGDVATEMHVAPSGVVTLGGATVAEDFPVTDFATLPHGSIGTFALQLDPTGGLSWSHVLRHDNISGYGVGNHRVAAIKGDAFGNTVVTGYAPGHVAPHNAVASGFSAGNIQNGFVYKFSPVGKVLLASDLSGSAPPSNGTSVASQPEDIALTPTGDIWVAGETFVNDFPLVNPLRSAYSNGEVFLTKISPLPDVKLSLTDIQATRIGASLRLVATLTNRGTEIGDSIQVSGASLSPGGNSLTVAPALFDTLGPGQSTTLTLTFTENGAAGAARFLKLVGAYDGGTYSISRRFTLP